jgi:hypothetical protein
VETFLPCAVPYVNRLDVLEPAMGGPPSPANKADLTSDTQDSDSSSLTVEVYALTRVDIMWPDVPQFTARVQHGSPAECTSKSPVTSTGNASSLPTPAEGTSVVHIVAACNASATLFCRHVSLHTHLSEEDSLIMRQAKHEEK